MSTNVAAADTQMAAAGLPSGSMSHPAGASAAPGGATVLQLTMAKMSAKLLTFQEKHTAELFDILTKGNRALDASSMGCGKTFIALMLAKMLGLDPFIVCPFAAIPGWIEVAELFGVKLAGISNYESLKNGRYYANPTLDDEGGMTSKPVPCPWLKKVFKREDGTIVKELAADSCESSDDSDATASDTEEDDDNLPASKRARGRSGKTKAKRKQKTKAKKTRRAKKKKQIESDSNVSDLHDSDDSNANPTDSELEEGHRERLQHHMRRKVEAMENDAAAAGSKSILVRDRSALVDAASAASSSDKSSSSDSETSSEEEDNAQHRKQVRAVRKAKKEARKRMKIKKRKFDYEFSFPANVFVTFDEAHRMKNNSSTVSKLLTAVFDIKNKVLLISATISDKIATFKMFAAFFGLCSHTREFVGWLRRQQNIHKAKHRAAKLTEDQCKLDCIHRALKPFTRRISKKDLPPGTFPEEEILAQCLELPHSFEVKQLMNELQQALEELKDKELRAEALAKLVRIRQRVEILKVPIFVKRAKEEIDAGRSVVAFFNFNESITQFQAEMHKIGVNSECVIQGGQSQKQRQWAIRQFQTNACPLISVNIQSGGVALSLHDLYGRQRVALHNLTWSGIGFEQACGRICRANGKSKALQYILLVKDTYEERIAELINEKLNVMAATNDGKLDGSDLTMENLLHDDQGKVVQVTRQEPVALEDGKHKMSSDIDKLQIADDPDEMMGQFDQMAAAAAAGSGFSAAAGSSAHKQRSSSSGEKKRKRAGSRHQNVFGLGDLPQASAAAAAGLPFVEPYVAPPVVPTHLPWLQKPVAAPGRSLHPAVLAAASAAAASGINMAPASVSPSATQAAPFSVPAAVPRPFFPALAQIHAQQSTVPVSTSSVSITAPQGAPAPFDRFAKLEALAKQAKVVKA